MTESNASGGTSKEVIAAIVMAGFVTVICIAACAGVAIAFLMNAPW